MINEFKYGQTWKIWPSPLSLSLYSTFKHFCFFFGYELYKLSVETCLFLLIWKANQVRYDLWLQRYDIQVFLSLFALKWHFKPFRCFFGYE